MFLACLEYQSVKISPEGRLDTWLRTPQPQPGELNQLLKYTYPPLDKYIAAAVTQDAQGRSP